MQARKTGLSESAKQHATIFLIFIVMLFVLGLPFLVRYLSHEPLLFGAEPYYHMRLAENIQKGGLPDADSLLFKEGHYTPNLYHIILASLFLFADHSYVSMLLPIFLGICVFFLFNQIMKSFAISFAYRAAALSILVLSPPFLSAFTRSSPVTFALFLTLFGLYLLTARRQGYRFFSVICFAMVPFLGVTETIVSILVLLGIFVIERHKYWLAIAISAIVLVIAFAWFYVNGFIYSISLYPVHELFSDLGGQYGVGVFNLLLGVIGLVFVWQRRTRVVALYAVGLCFAVMPLFDPKSLVYLIFLMALLGGIGYVRLYYMKWHLRQIRFLSMLILACGLLFSGTVFINSLAASGPQRELVQGLQWLGQQDTKVVLTHSSRSAWVQEIAQKKVLTDEYSQFYDFAQPNISMLNASKNMFYSRNLEKTKKLFNIYNISHVLIDPQMKSGLVWNSEEEGLLFLFRNNETFKRVYSVSGIEVWAYVGDR
jgi:hypothetical protein